MIQYVILGLAALCGLAAIVTLATGSISLTRSSSLKGPAARGVGLGLLVLGAAMAAFALYILPRL